MTPSIWEDVERRQAFLRAGRQAGEISEAEYAAAMARLRLQDENGAWWQIGDEGEWLFWDGAAWTTAAVGVRPGESPFTAAPQPPSTAAPQPPSGGAPQFPSGGVEREAAVPAMQVCPHCQAEVGVEKRFCTQCGHDLTSPLAGEESGAHTTQMCPHCQAQVGADKAFCTQCGQRLPGAVRHPSDVGLPEVDPARPPTADPTFAPPAAADPLLAASAEATTARRRGWLLWVFALLAVVVLVTAGFLGWQARQRRLALPVAPPATAVRPTPVMRVRSALGRQIAAKGNMRIGIAPDNLLPLRAPTPERDVMTGFEVEWAEAVAARLWGESFPVTWVLMPTIEGVRQVVSGEIDAFVGAPGHVAGVSATAPYLANDAALWAQDIGAEGPAAGWVIILGPGGDELAAEMDMVRDELVGEGVWDAIYRRWFNQPPPSDALPGWGEIPAAGP